MPGRERPQLDATSHRLEQAGVAKRSDRSHRLSEALVALARDKDGVIEAREKQVLDPYPRKGVTDRFLPSAAIQTAAAKDHLRVWIAPHQIGRDPRVELDPREVRFADVEGPIDALVEASICRNVPVVDGATRRAKAGDRRAGHERDGPRDIAADHDVTKRAAHDPLRPPDAVVEPDRVDLAVFGDHGRKIRHADMTSDAPDIAYDRPVVRATLA